jgi:hypothetical protein
VPLLRLKGRYIQLSLNSAYSSAADLLRRVVLLPEARRVLQWIIDLQMQDCRGPLWPLMADDCAIEVQTDASVLGWGGLVPGASVQRGVGLLNYSDTYQVSSILM